MKEIQYIILLNTVSVSGLSANTLVIKVGVPIMLMRNPKPHSCIMIPGCKLHCLEMHRIEVKGCNGL